MKKTIIQCDVCKKEVKSEYTFLLDSGKREPDPSGNGYISEFYKFDICASCIKDIILPFWTDGKIEINGFKYKKR